MMTVDEEGHDAVVPDAAEAIQHATQLNVADTNEITKGDSTYHREWRKYKEYVTSKRASGELPAAPTYLTRTGIDLYFSTIIGYKKCVPDTARRVVSALQFFADREEHIDSPQKFIVESRVVLQSLEAQRARYAVHLLKAIVDPHKDIPTDVLSQLDYRRGTMSILQRIDWGDFNWTFSVCDHTFIRFASAQKLRLCDIKLDSAHGPPHKDEFFNEKMISYILQPGGVHKDRAKNKNVVGGWRHQEVFRCSTGALAMSLLVRLREDGASIHFHNGPQGQPPPWWRLRVHRHWKPGKKGYDTAYTAYTTVFEALGISWSKVTHLRKSGIDRAGTVGLNNEATGSMSKHRREKQARYMPQLCHDVMCVMTGSDHRLPYSLSRSTIPTPNNCELAWAVDQILPEYDRWKAEQQSPYGDKSDAASDFLYQTIPFLVRVALQDGVYWVKTFPNHPASLLLKHAIPNYEVFATGARRALEDREAAAQVAEMDALNAASRAGFDNCSKRIDSASERLDSMEQTLQIIVALLRAQAWAPAQAIMPPPSNWFGQPVHGPMGTGPQVLPRANHEPLELQNVNLAVRNNPVVPPIPKRMAQSCLQLLQQHEQLELDGFENQKKSHWEQSMRLAFSKRHYMYKQILERARRLRLNGNTTFQQKKLEAARRMDEEREASAQTMSKYLDALKRADVTIQRRQRN